MRLERLCDGKFNGASCDSKRRNVLMIKSFLTQITQQAVEEGQVCTHCDVIISQDSSYVCISSQGQEKKTLNTSRKIYLVQKFSYFLFQYKNVYFCEMIFPEDPEIIFPCLIKEYFIDFSNIKKFSERIIIGFLNEKKKERKNIHSKACTYNQELLLLLFHPLFPEGSYESCSKILDGLSKSQIVTACCEV